MTDLFSIVTRITPLPRRPFWQGVLGAFECVAIIISPLIGGTIAHYTSWRVCFYITIGICVSTLTVVLLLFQVVDAPQAADLPIRAKLDKLDLVGLLMVLPAIITLMIGLQWGGVEYSWGDYHVIIPLLFAGALAVSFVVWQVWREDMAVLPPRLFKSRTVALSALFSGCNAATLYLMAYYVSSGFSWQVFSS